ncbi:hypothetical protein [Luteolibacter sp. LG18]|uniref:hypothetical protein n=1 Tax=Luteolibacter sp. LG18 TaxID=2819286 RepID=UPI002B2D8044|nr:hypothetical protein llg_28940 [Luteolibacter sp. LG18]
MDPFRKRQLIAYGLLGLGILLAVVAEFLPWMILHYSEFSRSSMPVGDIHIYLLQILKQNAVEVGHDTVYIPSQPFMAAGALAVWALVFLLLLASPRLVRYASKTSTLLWGARSIAVALCVPFVLWAGFIVRSSYQSVGAGMGVFIAALVLHAAGWFVFPRSGARD